MPVHRSRRQAFTLVELLTVIGIIAILAALTAIFFPSFQDQEMVNRGADQIQNWLLCAKMQAKRDGLPTGLQLTLDPSGSGNAIGAQYIQQRNSFAQGTYTGFTMSGTQMVAQLSLPPGPPPVSFTSGTSQVFAGDYLEVYGGGFLHQITAVSQSGTTASLTLAPNGAPMPTVSNPATFTNYRIIPQPQPMSGEEPLVLPPNIVISFEQPSGSSLSLNVPPVNGSYQILFAPSGAVVGQNTTPAQIVLWVRDATQPITSADLLVGKGTLITIQPRTGFIIAHPVASTASPYQFTQDGGSSGL